MAGHRRYILILILLAVLAFAFLALPNSGAIDAFVFLALPNTSAPAIEVFAKCTACHPQQVDELKRAPFHKSIQCTGCHKLGSFGQDLRSHDATTLTCSVCHTELLGISHEKPLDHTSFNLVYYKL
jgi:hypothetical protein